MTDQPKAISPITQDAAHYCMPCWSDPKYRTFVRLEHLTQITHGDRYVCPACHVIQECEHTHHWDAH